jgi:hypothetical protein
MNFSKFTQKSDVIWVQFMANGGNPKSRMLANKQFKTFKHRSAPTKSNVLLGSAPYSHN